MKITQFALCAVLGLSSVAAHSQQNTLRIGIGDVTIHSDSANLTSNGPAFLTPQPAGITVGDATTLLITYIRQINEHFDLELALGIPPRHDVTGTGTVAPFGVVARVKQFAPSVLFNYNFGAAESKFRPFVGLGVNYTRFFDADSTASGDLANGGPTKISLTDSVGLAAHIGATYKLANQWSISGSIGTAKVKSDLTTSTGSIERKTTIDFRPVLYSLSVGYSF